MRPFLGGFSDDFSGFYGVPVYGIRVLAARPLRLRENWATELFGNYDPSTRLIPVWMRTAVRKDITSFGTLALSFEPAPWFAKTGLELLSVAATTQKLKRAPN